MNNYALDDLKEKIRGEVNIVDLISEYVHLEKKGKNFVALCPFHQENTPSFIVSPERQTFKCFGCGEGGNAISFLMKYEGLSFSEAIKNLARRLGLDASSFETSADKSSKSNLQNLRQLNKFAAEYFQRQLLNNLSAKSALQYLKKRGLKLETIEIFKIGYATSSWNDFFKIALKEGFSEESMLEGGLILSIENRKQEIGNRKEEESFLPTPDTQHPTPKYRDRFYGRLIFPICDEWGEVVGFGGRILESEAESNSNRPKYINSPDTPLYHKSQILYNLNLAKSSIQKLGKAILTEGYLDAIIPYQEGISNVVASLGTALSETHAKLLKRQAGQVVIVYDPDTAGLQATARGLNLLVRHGITVKVALLPSGEDPDSFVRKRSAAEFNKLIDKAIDLIDFQIHLGSKEHDISTISGKVQLVNEVLPTLAQIKNRVELGEYVKKLAVDLHLEEMDIWQELKKLGIFSSKTLPSKPSKLSKKPVSPSKRTPREEIEYKLLSCLVHSPNLIPIVKEQLSSADFSNSEHSKIAKLILDRDQGSENQGSGVRGQGSVKKEEKDLNDPRPPTLDTQHPTPDTQHPTPNTRPPTPDPQHPTPNTQIDPQWSIELQNILDSLSEDEQTQSLLSEMTLNEQLPDLVETFIKGCIKRIKEFQKREDEEKLIEIKRDQFSEDPIALAKILKELKAMKAEDEKSQNRG